MSIALTPTFIKRGILIVLLATLAFATGNAVRDTDAQQSSFFVACVNKYTGVMRQSNVEPDFSEDRVAEPSEEVDFCQPHEEAWAFPIAFPISNQPSSPCLMNGERAAC